MERLTDKRFAKEGYFELTQEERDSLYIPSIEEIYRKLAEYEDLEEQERLIKLPCKIGDKVYLLSGCGYDQGYKITSITYYDDDEIQDCEFGIESDDRFGRCDSFELDDIGKTVFLNKHERNKKLAECIRREEEEVELKRMKGE